jgi:hypothetical protein
MNMQVSSSAFADNGTIPVVFTGDGANISPPIAWSKPPAGAQSVVLLVEDPDAPMRTFVHWLLFNIPPGVTEIAQGSAPAGAAAAINDAGEAGYFGPKPPSGAHHYHFKVMALDTTLPLGAGAAKDDVLKAMAGHVIGEGELVGIYGH